MSSSSLQSPPRSSPPVSQTVFKDSSVGLGPHLRQVTSLITPLLLTQYTTIDLLFEIENLAAITAANNDPDRPFHELLRVPQSIQRSCTTQEKFQTHNPTATCLVNLEGSLGSASKVQQLAGMLQLPQKVTGTGDNSEEASFCFVSGREKSTIVAALSKQRSRADPLLQVASFTPTFIRIDRAQKALSSDVITQRCVLATIQHFLRTALLTPSHIFLPSQSQYPVWYFLYGTLADPNILAEKQRLPVVPHLGQATVEGGIIPT
ncbi:uncharacterized protein BJX67DRAFT_45640 [Aspergillus lucknowensis]|uniref:Gamma-glutamylcyclotransferase AIG2-like domain-containing protein n=1 Tax=Aspergillus lucknowensis TaxID=176173 RepID=A0ABR4LVU1_9EURO